MTSNVKIVKRKRYHDNLRAILRFIALDNPDAARRLKREVNAKIDTLPGMPLKYRRSIYYDDNRVRDLIHKGYVIPYLVDESREKIVILTVLKWRERT